MISARLRLVSFLTRALVKPRLRAAQDPLELRRAFEKNARLLHRAPPHMAMRAGRLGKVPVEWVSCGTVDADDILFYVHGGAFVAGSPATHRHIAAHLCARLRCEAVLPDYRLAPEHVFPAGLEDVLAAYDALVASGRDPARITVLGDSAGGNLVMGLLARLDRNGSPMPRAAVVISPVLDLSATADSIRQNAARDVLLPADRFDRLNAEYLGGHPVTDPRVSPVLAQYRRLPPMLFHVSEGEILRDDTLNMQAKLIAAGHDPLVRCWPGAFHVFHILRGWLPEAGAALDDIAAFIRARRPASDS